MKVNSQVRSGQYWIYLHCINKRLLRRIRLRLSLQEQFISSKFSLFFDTKNRITVELDSPMINVRVTEIFVVFYENEENQTENFGKKIKNMTCDQNKTKQRFFIFIENFDLVHFLLSQQRLCLFVLLVYFESVQFLNDQYSCLCKLSFADGDLSRKAAVPILWSFLPECYRNLIGGLFSRILAEPMEIGLNTTGSILKNITFSTKTLPTVFFYVY